MSDKKQDKKPAELTSDDLDKAVGGGIMIPESRVTSSEEENKVTSKEEAGKSPDAGRRGGGGGGGEIA